MPVAAWSRRADTVVTRVNPLMLGASAVLLAFERVAYAVIWHWPAWFARRCRGHDAVDVLACLFGGFKAMQGAVFLAWCLVHGGSLRPASTAPLTLVLGALLVAAGQLLNLSVFARLGRVGVFYGNRLGYDVPWCRGFPFTWVRHPQYVGTVLSIWGFFVVMRYPEPDWVVLPLLQSLYYLAGALVERTPDTATTGEGPEAPATVPVPPASRFLR